MKRRGLCRRRQLKVTLLRSFPPSKSARSKVTFRDLEDRVTEELAARDAYLRETPATGVEVTPEGVLLDRTVVYARGGGDNGAG